MDDNLDIIRGYYDAAKARAHRIESGRPARECELLSVWKLTEKQSDVALALHAYSDAVRNEVDQIVVVTNDTARKWLNVPCERLDNRIPIEMCNDDNSARQLRAYMDAYAAEAKSAKKPTKT